MIAPRSYIVETKDKARYRRNRKHLQKIKNEERKPSGLGVKDQKEKEKEKTFKYAPKQEETRSSELSRSNARSRYGRTIKKPSRFNT